MALEIERKFRLSPDRLPPLSGGEKYIQGYLSENPEVRFRIIGETVILAVKKSLAPGKRLEFEFPREDMTEGEIRDLQSLALWPPLSKTRYAIPHEGLLWEVDVYEGDNRGLVTAEVELPDLDHPLAFPDWIDPDSEITADTRYTNLNLTRRPFGSSDSDIPQ